MKSSLSLLFILSMLAISCTSAPKARQAVRDLGKALHIIDDPTTHPPSSAPDEYRKGVTLLEKENFAEGLNALEDFLRQQPTSPWTQAALLNSGIALEGLGRWSEAKERYRRVIVATSDAPKLQAMALYRLSFTHEALGEDQDTVATLNDLLSPTYARASNLSPEIARAELPARLAGAYARVGNFEKSVEAYRQAEQGIALLRKEGKNISLPNWYPRTLYYMGSMSLRHVTWDDFETALRPLARSQIYLLEAAELGVAPWAEKAAHDLMATYGDFWKSIEAAPVAQSSDPVVALRAIQEKQWQRAALLEENLTELRARVLPETEMPRNAQAQQILSFLGDVQVKITALLNQRPVGEGPTPEATARRRAVRARVVPTSAAAGGKVDDELERKFLQDAKSAKSGDPNL